MKSYTFEHLAQFVLPDELAQDTPLEEVEGYTDEFAPTTMRYLDEIGFSIRSNTITLKNPDSLQRAIKFANDVINEYDSGTSHNPDSIWTRFELGGDDDVDYNGGYLLCLTELIERADKAAAQ